MPKFKFRLQGYLGLKEKMEDQRKLEYGQAMTELERERDKLRTLEIQRTDTLSSFREGINSDVNPSVAGFHNSFLTWLKEAISRQIENVKRAEAEAERRRVILAEAMKERKMLETLKDKHYENFVREQNIEEQKIVDEIVSFRHGKRE